MPIDALQLEAPLQVHAVPAAKATSPEARTHPLAVSIHRTVSGSPCVKTTFYSTIPWAAGTDGVNLSGQMYVEMLEPLHVKHNFPVILIHGDFHTGQIWLSKPDGRPGWAAKFLDHGYRVFVVDLPGCGRSQFLLPEDYHRREMWRHSDALDAVRVERELTAPEKQPAVAGDFPWPTVELHSQWPGTGQRGDAIFEQYMASLSTIVFRKAEREALAQLALKNLLQQIGTSVLVGQGAGCTAAWLAADAVPNLVARVVAIEPAGPPCAKAFVNTPSGRLYSPYLRHDTRVRKYGLSDIPLNYSPPAAVPTGVDSPALDIAPRQLPDNNGCYMAQIPIPGLSTKNLGQEPVRQLVNLKQMRHVIITGQASHHCVFDWATVRFLRQAGVCADYFYLPRSGIFGNGHLMFLEKNSDQIAELVIGWIDNNYARPRDDSQVPGGLSRATRNPQRSLRGIPRNQEVPAPGRAAAQPFVAGQVQNPPHEPPASFPELIHGSRFLPRARTALYANTPDVLQPVMAVADAGSQPQVQLGSNGMISPIYEENSITGQGQPGAGMTAAWHVE
ncbi:hypothetical protein Trco_002750 [Trichoderma cornu-damae]|uniref:AB hydrolase-1 domain-containing protein n=1 Tax=Trichoderma cornu-damae TaxID=654480 RepID=A0A9P8QQF1_9HYPO|nr:hypothetical protein Trco_002750 [Trichoderma cornu-damae]